LDENVWNDSLGYSLATLVRIEAGREPRVSHLTAFADAWT
jgi:hypothetical protein